MVVFDRSPGQLFSLRFSNRSAQAPSCERPKTTHRILFLSFEIKNCFQILRWCKKICKIQITPTILHPALGNNNCLQIIETGFAEQFWASHRMRTEQICLKISARTAGRPIEFYTTVNPPLFSMAKTLKCDIKNIIITNRISLLRVYCFKKWHYKSALLGPHSLHTSVGLQSRDLHKDKEE